MSIDTTAANRAISLTGVLANCNAAGLLDAADLHPVLIAARLVGETNTSVLAVSAFALNATRAGSICIDVAQIPTELQDAGELEPTQDLLAALQVSPLVGYGPDAQPNQHPFRLDGTLLYAERFWLDQETVRRILLTRRAEMPPQIDATALESALNDILPKSPTQACETTSEDGEASVRAAIINALRSWTSVIAGGPGTGKTTTVGKVLRAAASIADRELNVALAAPTGKAAGRLQAVTGSVPDARMRVTTGTLHRILGSRGVGRGFRYGRNNPLPYDLVVVDEMSMVSLPLMAALLSALAPDTRLILVGDPDQLASVEAGAVLADIVDADISTAVDSDRPLVTRLTHGWRYGGGIAALAEAIRVGDADQVLGVLRSNNPDVHLVEVDAATPDAVTASLLNPVFSSATEQTRAMLAAATRGDAVEAIAALDTHRLLTAHRDGPYGASSWQRRLQHHLTDAIPGYGRGGQWHLAAPILITGNAPDLGVYNGDQGVVVTSTDGPKVAFDTADGVLLLPPGALPQTQSAQALTIHKSQGSQFDTVSVILPEDSRLLSRQLLYTAVTRAKRSVRLIGTETALRRAVTTLALRASGLATRLRVGVI